MRAKRGHRAVKRKRVIVGAAIVVAALGLLTALPILRYLMGGVSQNLHQQKALRQLGPADHEAIAQSCALLRRQIAEEVPVLLMPSDPRLPAPVSRLRPAYVYVDTSEVVIEMHGGFDHFGLKLVNEPGSPHRCILHEYWEGGSRRLLTLDTLEQNQAPAEQ